LTVVLLTWQGEYMTIHITPEAKFSYVSFESNIPQSSYMDVIARVLETFRPGKFIVTSFANKVLYNIQICLIFLFFNVVLILAGIGCGRYAQRLIER
jgi:hypothetical protein